jgi:SAM-dependent methyltransferase
MRSLTAYDLKFFYKSFSGRVIRKIIREKLLTLWPEKYVKNISVMGYGYALPYLRPYMKEAATIYNMMPIQLGVHNWPPEGQNCVYLSDEGALPLATNSVDRVIMVHGLEFLDFPEESFEELWRVLKSTGRIIIVVPNRMGFWARADWNPFGQGKPYSSRQVESFLKENLFVHERTTHALFSPPFQNNLLLRAAHIFEKIGSYLYPALGGVTVIEASKQLYAGKGTAVRVKNRLGLKKVVSVKPVATPRVKH